jgi:hypothetical protein
VHLVSINLLLTLKNKHETHHRWHFKATNARVCSGVSILDTAGLPSIADERLEGYSSESHIL